MNSILMIPAVMCTMMIIWYDKSKQDMENDKVFQRVITQRIKYLLTCNNCITFNRSNAAFNTRWKVTRFLAQREN